MERPTTLLHVSDLHFGPPFVPAVGEALLEIVPRLELDGIVVSGDLTQRAKSEQFEAARRFLDRLPDVPRVVVPGNHDVPLYRVFERLLAPRARYRRHVGEQFDRRVAIGRAWIVALDSTAPRRAIINGRIHRSQLAFCAEAFADAPAEAVKVVVAHHHFAPAPDYQNDQVMPKARRALDHFAELGVDLILGGHLHRSYIGNSLDVYPGTHRDRGIIIVQSGTTTSRRGRAREQEKNTFNLIRLAGEMCVVTHFMYYEERGGFAPTSRHHFPLPGRTFRDLGEPQAEAPPPR